MTTPTTWCASASASNAGTSSPTFWGIVVDAPPPADQRPPTSPFEPIDQGSSSAPSELLSGTLQHVGVFGNLLSGDTDGVGLEADAGYGARDIKLVAESNALEGFGSNIVIYECTGGSCSGTGFVEVSLHCNRIVDSVTDGVFSNATTAVDARDNWWGCNDGPGTGDCDAASYSGTAGFLDGDPWLVLGLTAVPDIVPVGGPSTATADLRFNSDGIDTSGSGAIPDDTPVDFAATGGTVDPTAVGTILGQAISTYTAGAAPGELTAPVAG